MKRKTRKVQYFKLEKELAKQSFRVSIFGSARIKRNNKYYREIFKLAKMLGYHGIDVVSGGGPGIMEAANSGHAAGRKAARNGKTKSYGLTIELPKEMENKRFDMKKDFRRFSARLDYFMELSDAVVVAPGGVGTLLEFLYTWQLVQVEHIKDIPIIMLGEQWAHLVNWIKKGPLKNKLISPEDLEPIYIVKNANAAYKIINTVYWAFKRAASGYKYRK